MPTTATDKLGAEQRAFDKALPSLLESHRGEFVIFSGKKPVGFHDTFDEAYSTALGRFGSDGVFLISEVKEFKPESLSLSWDLGVMCGEG